MCHGVWKQKIDVNFVIKLMSILLFNNWLPDYSMNKAWTDLSRSKVYFLGVCIVVIYKRFSKPNYVYPTEAMLLAKFY